MSVGFLISMDCPWIMEHPIGRPGIPSPQNSQVKIAACRVPPTDPRWPKVLSLSVHEFRTPMTVVAGYIRMLLKDRAGPLSDQQRKLLEEAEKSCGAADGAAGRGQRPVQPRRGHGAVQQAGQADLNAVAAGGRRTAAAAAGSRGPDQRSTSTMARRPVEADPVRLTQAFASIIAALRRELIGEEPLIVRGRPAGAGYEILIGDADDDRRARRGRPADRGVFDEWRGGVGLSPRGRAAHHRTRTARRIFAAPDGRKAGARILLRSA